MKTKIKTKIILMTILAIGCLVTPMLVQGKSTKLAIEGTEVLDFKYPLDKWTADGWVHMILYKEATTSGYIDGIPFVGHNVLTFQVKLDPTTGDMIIHGKVTFFITWNGLDGSFYGPVHGKKVAGDMQVKITLQGAGDYLGWKFFGDVWNLNPAINGFAGTILIPN